MPSFLENLKQLPARSKAAFAISAAAILAIAVLLLQIAGAPSYATLVSGIEPAQTGEVTAALDEQGIPYELQANGTTVAVEKASVAKARVALATAGVSAGSSSGVGFELFDEQKLGASDYQQKVTYQRALEGEIERTLSSVDGVTGAQVQLVLPEDELFADSETAATAAVMLENPADTLEEGAVKGIAQLVASSVKNLKTSAVTITDATGTVLWPQEGSDAAGGVGSSTKQSAEARYERELQAKLTALMTRTLGPNKAEVTVKASLNVDKTTRDEVTYAKRGVPLEQTTETEELEGGATGAVGAAGTDPNIPTYAQNGAAGAGSNYERESDTTKFGVNKRVDRTEVAQGQVEGLQVALLVDQSVDPATFAALDGIVQRAAGMDPARGDAVESLQVAFAEPAEEPEVGPVPVALLGQLKWVGLALATLLFLFFMVRSLRKRESEEMETPAWLTQISQPTPLSALEAPKADPPTQILQEREPNFQLQTMEQIMQREPERVAAQVKAWMSED